MDNDKFQELVLEQLGQLNNRLEKVDSRLEKVELGYTGLEQGQAKVAKHVTQLGEDVKTIHNSQVRMENELTEKIRGLYDFREVQDDINDRIIPSLGRIEAKVDVLQMETANIRRVK